MRFFELCGLPKLPATLTEEMQVSVLLTLIQKNRESIIASWLAETGLKPSEAVLCMQNCLDGTLRLWVETKEKHERRMARFQIDPLGEGGGR